MTCKFVKVCDTGRYVKFRYYPLWIWEYVNKITNMMTKLSKMERRIK